MKSNYLKIGQGVISQVHEALEVNRVSGKILYVADPFVDSLYGSIVRPQIESAGKIKVELCSDNTIAYSMNIAERAIATDIDCIVGMGGGRTLDVCKYAAFVSKTPYLSIPTTAANDGMVSPIAVLKRQDEKPKSLGSAMPSMVLIDTDIIAKGPLQNIKAAGTIMLVVVCFIAGRMETGFIQLIVEIIVGIVMYIGVLLIFKDPLLVSNMKNVRGVIRRKIRR